MGSTDKRMRIGLLKLYMRLASQDVEGLMEKSIQQYIRDEVDEALDELKAERMAHEDQ